MDVELKKPLPEEGVEWVFVRSQAKMIKDGRMDLEVWIFDPDMDVVAVSHHVCFVMALKSKGKKGEGRL
jgi:Thioesterase-like superfamily